MGKMIDGVRLANYIKSVQEEYENISAKENDFERGARFAREQDIEIIKRFMEDEEE